MDQFEFFFAFFGLLLGLALAELLNGYANILREKVRPDWGLITPMLGLLIMVEIAATFIDAWGKLKDIDIDLIAFAVPGSIGVAYYVAAVMAVPRHVADWTSLDDYFYARRKWIVGLLIGANLGHLSTELPSVISAAQDGSSAFVPYLLRNVFLFGAYTALLLSNKRWLSITAIIAVLLFFAYVYGLRISWQELWSV